jgi:hypothetical protein
MSFCSLFTTVIQPIPRESPCENDVFRIIARITLPARLQTNKIAAMKRQTVPMPEQ